MANYCSTCRVKYTAREHHCVEKKICRTCGQEKQITHFPHHPSSFDGHKHDCNLCYDEKKQKEKSLREEDRIQRQQKKEQHAHMNQLLNAYGYRWKKEIVDHPDGLQEEQFVLYTPAKKQTTLKQALSDVAILQAHMPGHSSAVWAQEILSLPNVVTLDTETTGLGQDDEIIEIAIWDIHKQHPYATFIQCQQDVIPKDAERKHGITKDMLQGAPTWQQIWPKLMSYLANRVVIIYNSDYDLRMLEQTARRYNLHMPELNTRCLMRQYASYVGLPSFQTEKYRPLKLAAACAHFQIEQTSAHRALADAQATAQVMQKLAALAQTENCGLRLEPSIDAPVIKLLLDEYNLTKENACLFLRNHQFIVPEHDEHTLQQIKSPSGKNVSIAQALAEIEQKRLHDLDLRRQEQELQTQEHFKKSVATLKEMLLQCGEARNEASAWGYSPYPLAKKLENGLIEVTTYHFEGEWKTSIFDTEEEVITSLYTDMDGGWYPGEWTKPA